MSKNTRWLISVLKSYLISRAEFVFWSELKKLKISKHFEFLHFENFEALFNDVISTILKTYFQRFLIVFHVPKRANHNLEISA